MGRMTAEGYKKSIDDGSLSLENAISIHLSSNHYPPLPSTLVPVALKALTKAKKGEWEKKIRLPEGLEHKIYGKLVPVQVVMDYMHLEPFLE